MRDTTKLVSKGGKMKVFLIDHSGTYKALKSNKLDKMSSDTELSNLLDIYGTPKFIRAIDGKGVIIAYDTKELSERKRTQQVLGKHKK
jgi:hypothetical protein